MPTPDLSPSCAGKTNRPRKRQRSYEYAIKRLIEAAWNAEATSVWITLPRMLSADPIQIADDGPGMTLRQLAAELDRFRHQHRRREKRTLILRRSIKNHVHSNRFVGLQIAESISIETCMKTIRTRCTLSKADLANLTLHEQAASRWFETETSQEDQGGTVVTLHGLSQAFSPPSGPELRTLLALDYAGEHAITLFVNGVPVGIDDLPGKPFEVHATLENIGPVHLRYTVVNPGITLRSYGVVPRLSGERVHPLRLFRLADSGLPSTLLQRVCGELACPGIDKTASIELHGPYCRLAAWAEQTIGDSLSEYLAEEVNRVRTSRGETIDKIMDSLPKHRRKPAEEELRQTIASTLDKAESGRNAILDATLGAFERSEYWAAVEETADYDGMNPVIILEGIRRSERVLDQLDRLIADESTTEKQMHDLIQRNLWVLGYGYACVSSNKTLDNALESYLGEKYPNRGPTTSHGRRRPDLWLVKSRGDHFIIEFKRPKQKIDRDAERQAQEYRDYLTTQFPRGQVHILLIGGGLDDSVDRNYIGRDIKIVSYTNLVSEAREQWAWVRARLSAKGTERVRR